MRDNWFEPTIDYTRDIHRPCGYCNERPMPFPYQMTNLGVSPTWKCRCGRMHRGHIHVIKGDNYAMRPIPANIDGYEDRIAYVMREQV